MAMDLSSLEALQNLNQPVIERKVSETAEGGRGTRLDALRNAGLSVGARGALIAQTKIINTALKRTERTLDTTYNFQSLMIEGRVVPAVLTESRDVYTQEGDKSVLLSGIRYKIESLPRFTSRAPTWREYLYMEPGDLSMASLQLLPRDSNEQQIWRQAVTDGWRDGLKQADEIFDANAKRLNRDYTGMIRYRVLALNNKITMPMVAQSMMPINSSGDTMTVDEQLLRITRQPAFNPNMAQWEALGQEVGQLQRQGDERAPTVRKLPEPR
ncbi:MULTISPECIES: type IV secretory system conjugative DNA transfer family protein [Cupriavidus]